MINLLKVQFRGAGWGGRRRERTAFFLLSFLLPPDAIEIPDDICGIYVQILGARARVRVAHSQRRRRRRCCRRRLSPIPLLQLPGQPPCSGENGYPGASHTYGTEKKKRRGSPGSPGGRESGLEGRLTVITHGFENVIVKQNRMVDRTYGGWEKCSWRRDHLTSPVMNAQNNEQIPYVADTYCRMEISFNVN